MLYVSRRRHDDVLEWVVLLNLEGELVYDLVWGDKDTYRLAFALAGKGPAFTQVRDRPLCQREYRQMFMQKSLEDTLTRVICLGKAIQGPIVHGPDFS